VATDKKEYHLRVPAHRQGDPRFSWVRADICSADDVVRVREKLAELVKDGYILCCHASPPCNTFSSVRTTGGEREIQPATNIAEAWHALADEFNMIWVAENPATSLLWDTPFGGAQLRANRLLVDYCANDPGLHKPTLLAANMQPVLDLIALRNARVLCPGRTLCDHADGRCHVSFEGTSLPERHLIPPSLAYFIQKSLWHVGMWVLGCAREQEVESGTK
jgi:hypothetical protein